MEELGSFAASFLDPVISCECEDQLRTASAGGGGVPAWGLQAR
jgi:hypothetical protein